MNDDDKSDPDNVIPFPHIERVNISPRARMFGLGMYILVDKKPVLLTDTMQWASSFGQRHREMKQTGEDPWRVALTDIENSCCYVSTVFLGLDHNFFGGRALLFETMIFHREPGEERFDFQERCSTWDEAVEQHERGVQWARANALKTIGKNGDD